jgi:hypothetical protein
MPYNATLCKEALGKVFVAFLIFCCGVMLFWAYKNFFERWQGVANGIQKF